MIDAISTSVGAEALGTEEMGLLMDARQGFRFRGRFNITNSYAVPSEGDDPEEDDPKEDGPKEDGPKGDDPEEGDPEEGDPEEDGPDPINGGNGSEGFGGLG